MTRPIREDCPGAWHHVMNRGRNRELIFRSDEDAFDVLSAVGDTVERLGIEVHAYSLMPNHYLTHRAIGKALGMTVCHVAREVRRNRDGIAGFDRWSRKRLQRFPKKVSLIRE